MSEIERLKKELYEIDEELTALNGGRRVYKALEQRKMNLEAIE